MATTSRTAIGTAARTVHRWHPPLVWTTGLMALALAGCLVAWAVDDRMLTGMPIWAKPAKFAVSLGVYALTLAWMTSLLTRFRRTAWWAGTTLAAAAVGEMVIIVGQALRGRTSHYNGTTPLDLVLYSAMGALVTVLYTATLVVGVALLFTRLPEPALTWGVRLGVVVGLLGLSVGFLLVTNPASPAAEAAGLVGAHSVGVDDGGPGLPLLGWSTTGGDLRIGHFLGMHALQGLPLLALALGARWDAATRVRVVVLAAASWAGVTVLVVWQALRAQPLLAPDGATLAAAGALAAFVAAGAVAVVAARGRSAASSGGAVLPGGVR